MKLKNVLVSLLVTVTLFSCKNEGKSETKEEATTIEKPSVNKNVFSVTLNAIVRKDDSFQIFYKENENDAFEEKNSMYVEFKGSENAQDIIFNLPEDVLPNYLRLDLGVNKEQEQIKINKLKFNYFSKNFEIKGKDYLTYFYLNEATTKIDTSGVITPILGKDGGYDPMSASSEGLRLQIESLLK
jgi:hypothetical protein